MEWNGRVLGLESRNLIADYRVIGYALELHSDLGVIPILFTAAVKEREKRLVNDSLWWLTARQNFTLFLQLTPQV